MKNETNKPCFIQLKDTNWYHASCLKQYKADDYNGLRYDIKLLEDVDGIYDGDRVIKYSQGRIFQGCHLDCVHFGTSKPIFIDRTLIDSAVCRGIIPVTHFDD